MPGFSCPPTKLWDQDGTTGRAICVDCRGAPPPPEQRTVACPPTQEGTTVEGRDFFCQANTWRPGPWQLISNTCACPANTAWNGKECVLNREGDVCQNILGIQPTPPDGYIVINQECVPIRPVCLAAGATSAGFMWRNGADPYWNSLMNQLDVCAAGWRTAPPGNDFIRQAVDYLANRWIQGPCMGGEVAFGNVRVRCQKSWEDIVSTRWQTGPFYLITLDIRAL